MNNQNIPEQKEGVTAGCAPATGSAARLCYEDEQLIEQCIEVVRSENTGSVSLLQRRLRLGYTRAARLMDELERRGVVSAPLDDRTTMRTVLPNYK